MPIKIVYPENQEYKTDQSNREEVVLLGGAPGLSFVFPTMNPLSTLVVDLSRVYEGENTRGS